MAEQPELKVLNNVSSEERGINRRQMVRRLMSGVGAGVALPAVAGSHPIHNHLADAATLAEADAQAQAAEWKPLFLNTHQNETVIVLAERIVPGSTNAKVNQFIDLLLSVDSQENQQKFNNSLAAFEADALKRHSHPFKALSEAEQNEILTAASTMEPGKKDQSKDYSWFAVPSGESGEPPTLTLRDHFENLKGWVSGAYYSSEVGMRELGWTGQVMFESFPGCQHPDGHA